jgi:hypothetical protein
MPNEKATQVKPDKKKIQLNQQIFHNLLEIVELFPQYNLVQHFASVIRRKSDTEKQFYDWSEEFFLKRIEQHREELEKDLLGDTSDDDVDY